MAGVDHLGHAGVAWPEHGLAGAGANLGGRFVLCRLDVQIYLRWQHLTGVAPKFAGDIELSSHV
jgi:hypothetical protein